MKSSLDAIIEPRLVLAAETAADLMTGNPVSIRSEASIREAIALLTDKGISAAPVIDEAGLPVGVVSRTDILVHDREKVEYMEPRPEYFSRTELTTHDGEDLSGEFQVERVEVVPVRDVMTPVVFSISREAPARRAVQDMLALKVHRLFVVDGSGVLVGVISAIDILKHLSLEVPAFKASGEGHYNHERLGIEPWE
jgi:CBS domain-containing protein